MSYVTQRPVFKAGLAPCQRCHHQLLRALSGPVRAKEFDEAKIKEAWRVDILVGMCQICREGRLEEHTCAPRCLPAVEDREYITWFTDEEMTTMYFAAVTGGFAEAPMKVRDSNLMLSVKTIKNQKHRSALTSTALREILPYVVSALAGQESTRQPWTLWRTCCCWNPPQHRVSRTFHSITSRLLEDSFALAWMVDSSSYTPGDHISGSSPNSPSVESTTLEVTRSQSVLSGPSSQVVRAVMATSELTSGITLSRDQMDPTSTSQEYKDRNQQRTGMEDVGPLGVDQNTSTASIQAITTSDSADSSNSSRLISFPPGITSNLQPTGQDQVALTSTTTSTPGASSGPGVITPLQMLSMSLLTNARCGAASSSQVRSVELAELSGMSTFSSLSMGSLSGEMTMAAASFPEHKSRLRLIPVRTPMRSEVVKTEKGTTCIVEEMEFEDTDFRVVQICPAIMERVFHKHSIENVVDAVIQRKIIPDRRFTLDTHEREEVRYTTKKLMDRYFTVGDIENVAKWCIESDYVSSKWSEQRYLNAVDAARARHIPNQGIVHTAGIKLEPHKPGKAPRLLVADGDFGQIATILLLGVLERRLFTVYEQESIKGLPKDEAIDRVIQRTQLGPGYSDFCVMEADGSAFDMSVCLDVRDLVENMPLDKIQNVIMDVVGEGLASYADADRRTRRKAKFEIRVAPTKHPGTTEHLLLESCRKSIKVVIDSIRKSGQRGTSSLNWLTSKVLGAWTIYGKNAHKMMDKQSTGATDIFGKHRKYLPVYEGDDQLASVAPAFTKEEVKVLQERWAKLGFGMKIEIRTRGEPVEFTGWKLLVGDRGPLPGSAVPDIPRQLAHIPFSLSPLAVQAAKLGDTETLGQVAAASMLSCAYSLAPKAPTLAATLLRWADSWSPKEMFSHDNIMRLMPEVYELVVPEAWKDGGKVLDKQLKRASKYKHGIRDMITERITQQWSKHDSVEEECAFALAHGWCTTADEWQKFLESLEGITIESDDAAIRTFLPLKLRTFIL